MLTDSRIQQALHWGELAISDFDEAQLQPASYDVRLGSELLVMRDGSGDALDTKSDVAREFVAFQICDEGFVVAAGDFVLATTSERIRVGPQFIAQVEGKSSLGRLGLMVHSTAGYIDPGFEGQITLELSCVHDRGVVIYPGMRIGQLAFRYCGEGDRVYEGKYAGQTGPTASRYHQNWSHATEQWT